MSDSPTPMRAVRRAAPRLCRILEEDPDLAVGISPPARAAATAECVAPEVRIAKGRWTDYQRPELEHGIGLLVLDGLLVRRVGIDGRSGAELLGQGDLLRPWQQTELESSLRRTTGWRVLEPTRVAVLDVRVAYRLARYPELTGLLVGRALDRSRNFAVNMAIVHQPRVEVRLHMLFWHLAERWGRVGTDAIRLPIRLTHTVLSDLVAARRPTVTGSLAKLARQGLIVHTETSWLLFGDPPGELLQVRDLGLIDVAEPPDAIGVAANGNGGAAPTA